MAVKEHEHRTRSEFAVCAGLTDRTIAIQMCAVARDRHTPPLRLHQLVAGQSGTAVFRRTVQQLIAKIGQSFDQQVAVGIPVHRKVTRGIDQRSDQIEVHHDCRRTIGSKPVCGRIHIQRRHSKTLQRPLLRPMLHVPVDLSATADQNLARSLA